MAGDWIKLRADLHTSPKVVRIASALNADRLRVIGALHAMWCVFDLHSEDGSLEGYSFAVMDAMIGFPGFSAAVAGVGWLEEIDGNLAMPRFSEHNGKSAKRRAMESERKRSARESSGCTHDVRDLSASDADKKRTREEKRREEVNTPREPSGFAEFWSAYPKKTGKGAAEKAFKSALINGHLPDLLAAVDRQKRSNPDWLKDGGQYIPNPATWLNQRRWEDEPIELLGGVPAGLKTGDTRTRNGITETYREGLGWAL